MFLSTRIALISTVLTIVTIPASKAVAAEADDPCFKLEHATQRDLNECEFKEYKKSDDALNRAYQLLQAKYKANPDFLAKLKVAQLAWIAFRDADIDANYYQKDKQGAYGSVYPMCLSIFKTDLTEARTKELTFMLSDEEGDVCGFYALATSSQVNPSRIRSHCRAESPRPSGD